MSASGECLQPWERHYSNPACVTDVYLGSRMEQPERNRVREKLDGMPIKLRDMTIKKYSMNFSEI
jgi:hypothetical protein